MLRKRVYNYRYAVFQRIIRAYLFTAIITLLKNVVAALHLFIIILFNVLISTRTKKYARLNAINKPPNNLLV